jgi:hypothetical protein
MPWHHRLRAGLRPSLCALAVAAFLALGAPPIFRSAVGSSIQFAGPFHSSDNFLRFATGARNGSERLIALFDSLPPAREILIVVREDDQQSAFLGSLVAYLAWPHPVRIVDFRKGRSHGAAASNTIGAVAFCRVQPPPSWHGGQRFGHSLKIFSVQERK